MGATMDGDSGGGCDGWYCVGTMAGGGGEGVGSGRCAVASCMRADEGCALFAHIPDAACPDGNHPTWVCVARGGGVWRWNFLFSSCSALRSKGRSGTQGARLFFLLFEQTAAGKS